MGTSLLKDYFDWMSAAVHDHRSNEEEKYMMLDHLCLSFATRKDDRLKK